MKNPPKNSTLKEFQKLQQAASQTEDGHRCLVAPHPTLKKKLDAAMKKLDAAASRGVLSNRVVMGRPYKPVGFNDGLIYPGTEFPVGTSAAVARSAAASVGPLRGAVRVIVVLVDFEDKKMTETKSHFEDLFFSLNRKVTTGSVREYFREVSQDKIDIQGEVVGPYRLPKTLKQYAHGESGIGEAAPNARTMAKDAAVAANRAVDFSTYDNNNDGYVDAFVIIHAGTGGEMTGSGSDIWSHKWVLPSEYAADGNTKIYAYLTVPEDCKLGVCAHELGHLLFGFPDLYDEDGSSQGIGNWCLMAGGSWNNNGLTPAHPCAWCKAQQKWIDVHLQTKNQKQVVIKDVKSGYKAYRLWDKGQVGKEYYLVENRQKENFDKHLPNGGLLIWHIDDSILTNSGEVHYKVALMQADGKKDLEMNNNRGDVGDCYPGSGNKKKFNQTSNPNSMSYAGAPTNVSVLNISKAGASMKADLNVRRVTATKTAAKKTATRKK